MKVKEMIEQLELFDPDIECYIESHFKDVIVKTDDAGLCFTMIPIEEKDSIFIEEGINSDKLNENNKELYCKICIIGH